jgi:hypothetical protein
MQTIDSVSRAKAFIRSHARTAALVIVPLASAVSAHAIPVVNLPTGNYSCSYTITGGTGGTCSGGATTNPGSPGQIGGTSFFLSGDLNLGSSGGSIIMNVRGPVAAAIPVGTVIPVSWDFGMNPQQQQFDPPWSLTYSLGDTTTAAMLATGMFSGNSSGEITGNGSLTTTAASSSGNTLALRINFTESGDAEGGVNVIVSIPEALSIDVNPFSTNAVPEPSTLGLFGAGLAWLGYRLRKRRNT